MTGTAGATPAPDHTEGFPPGGMGRLLFWIAVAFSAFQIATAAHLIDLPSQIVRSTHVGFLMLLGFPLAAANRRSGGAGLGAGLASRRPRRRGRRSTSGTNTTSSSCARAIPCPATSPWASSPSSASSPPPG